VNRSDPNGCTPTCSDGKGGEYVRSRESVLARKILRLFDMKRYEQGLKLACLLFSTDSISRAFEFIGTKYRDDDGKIVRDCSLFVFGVYSEKCYLGGGDRSGYPYNRRAYNQYNFTRESDAWNSVSRVALQAGDLIFYKDNGCNCTEATDQIHHVAIYLGYGLMIDSTTVKDANDQYIINGVTIRSINTTLTLSGKEMSIKAYMHFCG